MNFHFYPAPKNVKLLINGWGCFWELNCLSLSAPDFAIIKWLYAYISLASFLRKNSLKVLYYLLLFLYRTIQPKAPYLLIS